VVKRVMRGCVANPTTGLMGLGSYRAKASFNVASAGTPGSW